MTTVKKLKTFATCGLLSLLPVGNLAAQSNGTKTPQAYQPNKQVITYNILPLSLGLQKNFYFADIDGAPFGLCYQAEFAITLGSTRSNSGVRFGALLGFIQADGFKIDDKKINSPGAQFAGASMGYVQNLAKWLTLGAGINLGYAHSKIDTYAPDPATGAFETKTEKTGGLFARANAAIEIMPFISKDCDYGIRFEGGVCGSDVTRKDGASKLTPYGTCGLVIKIR